MGKNNGNGNGNQVKYEQALNRAQGGGGLTNYPAIFQGFTAMGIPEDEINPRFNILTFDAWKALGRYVKKGEHGVKICSYIPMSKTVRDKDTGEEKIESWKTPRTVAVFHVSQTEGK